jgi:hypothetical protein
MILLLVSIILKLERKKVNGCIFYGIQEVHSSATTEYNADLGRNTCEAKNL